LDRGYAVVQNDKGSVIDSVEQVSLSESISITLKSGAIGASVRDIRPTRTQTDTRTREG
jgi:exonuclease VII large subunit